MSYDWKDNISQEKFSLAWFDDADRRFVEGASLFAHGETIFDRIIPFSELRDKRVLEIGCGMGLHTELMLRAGARVTSIDLSPTSVMATTKRLEAKGLQGDVRQMDAEKLDFPDEHFDFVWTWGVIHHSSHTGRAVREIHRVLKPGGETRIMVYNLEGMPSYLTMMSKFSWKFWFGGSLDELLWAMSDGYSARYYSRDTLADLLETFFENVAVSTFGQPADAIPLPRRLRNAVGRIVSIERQRRWGNARGSLIFGVARKAERSV